MAAFLAIYSKSKHSNFQLLENVVKDFTINGKRKIIKKENPHFLLCVVDTFKDSLFENENSLSLVSGYISFKKLNTPLDKTIPEKFNEVIINGAENKMELLEGAFAAIHYNKDKHTLVYTNDKFGMFPLFVFEDKDYIILSNEYQPLAVYNSQLNYNAITEFLTLGVTLGNKTFYKHIHNLPPSSYVIANENKSVKHVYWRPKPIVDNNEDKQAILIYETFTEINREYNNANITELCLLTAGADSRLILATLESDQLSKTKFYTSNLSFLDPLEDKDVIGASALANKFNLDHTIEKISFYENQFNESYFDTEREIRKSQVYGGWHGGEFLGGFFLKAAPIHKKLNFEEVDATYKSIFSWWFRFKHKMHPYHAYKNEIESLQGNEHLFMTHQMTRSFFTNIYSGTRGHWVQPFQLMNHGFSPFWDSRFLQLLIQVPLSKLENYNFYNKIFKYADTAFTKIPSNSPLTNREDSVIPNMDIGIEPKHQIPNTHHKAYTDCLNDIKIWKRNFYNKKEFEKTLENEFDKTTKQWLDFEVWYYKYIAP